MNETNINHKEVTQLKLGYLELSTDLSKHETQMPETHFKKSTSHQENTY